MCLVVLKWWDNKKFEGDLPMAFILCSAIIWGSRFFRYTMWSSAKDQYLGPRAAKWRRHQTMLLSVWLEHSAIPFCDGAPAAMFFRMSDYSIVPCLHLFFWIDGLHFWFCIIGGMRTWFPVEAFLFLSGKPISSMTYDQCIHGSHQCWWWFCLSHLALYNFCPFMSVA